MGEFGRVWASFRRLKESLGEFWESLQESGRVWETFRRFMESLVEFWESLGEFKTV